MLKNTKDSLQKKGPATSLKRDFGFSDIKYVCYVKQYAKIKADILV